MKAMNFIFTNKKLVVTAGVVLLCLALYSVFPTSNVFQEITSSLTFLLVIPLLYIKIILKRPFKDYGWQLGQWKRGVFWMISMLVMSLLVFYLLFHYTALPQKFYLPDLVREKFKFFVLYEIFLVGFFTALYEIFFRGVIAIGLSNAFGYWSIAIQFGLLLAFLLLAGSFNWSTYLYLISAPFAGLAACQSRSLFYSFGVSLFFIIIADAFTIGTIR